MKHRTDWLLVSVVVLACCLVGGLTGRTAFGQTMPAQERSGNTGNTGRPETSDRLGLTFEGPSSGISFRPPGELRRVDIRPGEIARYGSDADAATFVVRRIDLPGQGLPMQTTTQPKKNPEDANEKPVREVGMLETVAGEQIGSNPGEILRQDIVLVNNAEIGVIVLDVNGITGRRLQQIALVRVSDRVYYRLGYTVAAENDTPLPEQPDVMGAAKTFTDVIDTIRLVDRSDIRADQEQRLLNTRSLLVNWTEAKLRDSLPGKEWVRLIREGKDIGFTATFTAVGDGIPDVGQLAAEDRQPGTGDGDGIQVALRSRLFNPGGLVIDAEHRAFGTFTRNRERWTTLTTTSSNDTPAGEKTQNSFLEEVGVSSQRTKAVRDEGDTDGVSLTMEHTLTVTRGGEDGADPDVQRDLPPFYLPQSYATLLPRLLPLDRPRSYLFAQWVPDRAEIMLRYVDVLETQKIQLGEKTVEGIVIEDRIGLEGSKTRHVFDPATHAYLGSVNPEAKLLLLPSTEAEVSQLWDITQARGAEPRSDAK